MGIVILLLAAILVTLLGAWSLIGWVAAAFLALVVALLVLVVFVIVFGVIPANVLRISKDLLVAGWKGQLQSWADVKARVQFRW